MKKLLLGLALAALPLSAAGAQAMNAEVFHQRATALQKKGAMALFSRGEIRALMAEGKAAGDKAREQRQAALKAGQRPAYCPPPTPQAMGSDEFLAGLNAIPAAQRAKMTMTDAVTRILATKFPCR